jgi:cytochrome P450 family 6
MSSTLISIFAAAFLAFLWMKFRYSFWKNRGFIEESGTFPFGSLKGLGSRSAVYEFSKEFYETYKRAAPVIGYYAFLKPNVLLLDLELIKNVLTRDFQHFHDRAFYHNKKVDPLSAK